MKTKMSLKKTHYVAMAAAVLTIAGCGANSDSDTPAQNFNIKPSYLGAIVTADYDGTTDDLARQDSSPGTQALRRYCQGQIGPGRLVDQMPVMRRGALLH